MCWSSVGVGGTHMLLSGTRARERTGSADSPLGIRCKNKIKDCLIRRLDCSSQLIGEIQTQIVWPQLGG